VETDVIVARGFAELNTILELTQNIKCQRYLLLKGKKVTDEIKKAKEKWDFDYKIHEGKIDSFILEVKKNCNEH
jgi:16S rRNA G527 N7-methylase RsmG